MKFISKVFLVISFVISYVILLFSITAQFQLLDPNFWVNSFRSANVYQRLEKPLMNQIKETFIEEGAGILEANEISSVFSENNLKEIVEKNTFNFLDYINRKDSELIIYYPLNKLPISIRQDLELNSNEVSLDYLLSTFGRGSTPFGQEFFVYLRNLGIGVTISLIVTLFSLGITLYMIYRLDEEGGRLRATGLALILSGLTAVLLILITNSYVASMASELVKPDKELIQILLGTLLPPLVEKITLVWIIISLLVVPVGFVALFLKKAVKSPDAN